MKRKISLFKLTLALALGLMVAGPAGAAVSAALAFIPTGAYSGTARAGIIPEVWTGEMVKAFHYDDTATFMAGVPDYSQYVIQGNIIHLLDFGLTPDVLLNNTTYPLEVQDLDNKDISLTLDKYQTKPTRITDDTLYDTKGDFIAAAISEHKARIAEKKYDKAIHSIAPAQNVAGKTPVIKTTGEADGTRKRLTRLDIINLKKQFDEMHLPVAGRRLVLCPDHVADLLSLDQKFAEQYYNYSTGAITKMYGFEIFEYVNMPLYTSAGKKKAFGAAAATGDIAASIAFIPSLIAKATGSTKYYLSEASTDPKNQENLLNFRHYYMAMPKKAYSQAAIVSDVVTASAGTGSGD